MKEQSNAHLLQKTVQEKNALEAKLAQAHKNVSQAVNTQVQEAQTKIL